MKLHTELGRLWQNLVYFVHLFVDIETITSFAMLEFKHGEPERGKTLLDNILISYPKRTDIWSMYVDVLVKNNEVVSAR